MKTEVPPSVTGNGIDDVRQFDTAFGFRPRAAIPVHGAVKYRAAFRTDEMGVTGAFAALAGFAAIIVLGNAQWPVLRLYVALVVAAVNVATPGSFAEVDIPVD